MATKLSEITTQYHTFEDNQVLTKDQLNEFIDYFEDQDRLSRICLSGVGIVCGFELNLDTGKPSVTISQGAGVTTDGDLIKLRKNIAGSGRKSIDLSSVEYTHYKPFEDRFANYKFFKKLVTVDGKIKEMPIEMLELLTADVEGGIPLISLSRLNISSLARLKSTSLADLKETTLTELKDPTLSRFNESLLSALTNKVVLLYLEAYDKKADLCTSIDCDNQGVEQVARLRVLLVSKADADANPIIQITVQSDKRTLLELSEIADLTIKERLQTIPNVSAVEIWGENRYSMRLWLDPSKMAAYGVTPMDVKSSIDKENVELPSGSIEGDKIELAIRTMGLLQTPEDFNNLIIKEDEYRIVRFSDIGKAELDTENRKNILRRNGVPMVSPTILPQPGANQIEIADEVRTRLEQIRKDLPEDVIVDIALDNTKFIRASISEVEDTIYIAFALVIIIIFIFFINFYH